MKDSNTGQTFSYVFGGVTNLKKEHKGLGRIQLFIVITNEVTINKWKLLKWKLMPKNDS